MAELQQFIGEDSRTPIQRLRRCQLHKIADGFKLQYPAGATKDAMIQLFEANNIDVTQSPDVQWQGFHGQDVEGKPRQEFYPVVQPSASMRNGVNAAVVLNERLSAKEEEEQEFDKARIDVLERKLAQSERTNEQLKGILEERLAALENSHQKPVDKESPQSKYWAAYRQARDMNLPVERGMKLPEIKALIKSAANG